MVSSVLLGARFLPDVTSARELGTANTLGTTTWSVMLAFGAAIGGIITGLLGSQTAFVIDGFTFFVSAAFLLQIKLPGPPSAARGGPAQAKFTALRYMLRHPDILFIAMHKAAISLLLSTGVQVVLVDIARNYFTIGVGGALSLGMMYCMNGVGSGVGPILARRRTGDRDKPLRISISLGYVIAAVGIAIIAPLFNFQTVLFGGFVRSVGGGIVWVFSTQLLLQKRTKRNPRADFWDRVCPLYPYGWSQLNNCWYTTGSISRQFCFVGNVRSIASSSSTLVIVAGTLQSDQIEIGVCRG